MRQQDNQRECIGYVVSTWPRLSQTFVLSEVLGLERQGVRVRIYSVKDPGGEPVHGDVSQVQADVVYLTLRRLWRQIVLANLKLAVARPAQYFPALGAAVGYRRLGVVRRFWQAAYLASLLRRRPVRHLHAHFATAPALVAMFASRLTGTPYTFTTHAKDLYVGTQPRLLRAEIRHARAVVTISEYNRSYLAQSVDHSANGKVKCIYNGLDLRRFPFRERATAEDPLILGVGRLIEKKGFADLIAAAGILWKRGHRFRVEIIGAGPLREELEAIRATLGLEHVVTFLGAQPQEAIRQAYQRATLFVLPCVVTPDGDRDGIPTVLLEAMASGLACVSTNVSGIPELIESGINGLLAPPNRPLAVAEAIELLLREPDLRNAFAIQARKTIEQRFSIERSTRELIDVFREAAYS